MAAKFEIYEDAKGEFRFRLKAGNGEIVATGEGYKTKSGVINGVDAVKRAAAEAEIDDKTTTRPNGLIGFTRRGLCRRPASKAPFACFPEGRRGAATVGPRLPPCALQPPGSFRHSSCRCVPWSSPQSSPLPARVAARSARQGQPTTGSNDTAQGACQHRQLPAAADRHVGGAGARQPEPGTTAGPRGPGRGSPNG